ncbi:RNA-directed DNA polymerase, eukaryota, reverse transcriptase zinc-binding domain protein [Tanacetum coccineum]
MSRVSGCGTRIRFWKDIWVGETPLFTRYNRLYHLDQDKDCLIIDRINNGQWSWNWSRTNLGVRNLAYLCDMLNEIGQLNIDVNEDTCTWSLGPNGTFTVKDARYRIDQNILPTLAHTTTWDKSIPRKVNVFMWRLSLDRLPHRLNLSSRGMDIPAISCPSCNANVESANHVFFECDIATDMWKLVFRWCDIPLFQASSWDSFNDWIISWHASKEKKHRFYVITTSVLWWLWRYRNSVTFSSQPLRKSDLFDNVRFSSFSWLHNRDHMKLSWNDWLMYPLSITRNGNEDVMVRGWEDVAYVPGSLGGEGRGGSLGGEGACEGELRDLAMGLERVEDGGLVAVGQRLEGGDEGRMPDRMRRHVLVARGFIGTMVGDRGRGGLVGCRGDIAAGMTDFGSRCIDTLGQAWRDMCSGD